ncbi:MAG: SusC/RagA family TonB-linked outer membrane protein [Balneolaceae bacterium]
MFTKIVRSLLAFFIVAGISFGSVMAQDRVEVTGTVTDASDGSSLPGVNITVQGMPSVGTTTNLDGEYTLRVPADRNVLIFSFIGFIRQEVQIDGRTTINVALQPDIQLLDDVVVVGYGTQDRREITSAVSSVKAEDFNKGNIQDTQQLLQGKVAGLQISRPGGDPNAGFNIRLRGLSTIGANTEPLVVIDGVIGADFNTVDPNDIESIDVLKDASASAIYGTRGANGVILITTKGGGAPRGDRPVTVSYNGQVTTNFIENKLDVLSASEFRSFTQQQGITGIDLGTTTDWFDEITQNGFTQVHNLSISGGDAQTTYRVSANFRDTENIQIGTGFEQISGRLNITHRALNDRLTLTGNLSIVNRDEERGFGEVFRYAAAFNPTRPVRDEASPFGGFSEQDAFDMFNPVAIQELARNVAEQRRLVAAFRGDYEFSDLVPGLTAGVFYSLETFDETRGEFYAKEARFRGFGRNGLAIRGDVNNKTELFETTVRYTNSFERVRLESVAGYSFQEFINENRFIEAGDFVTNIFSFNRLDAAQDFNEGIANVSNFRAENRLIAAFGRVNLTFDNTYFLSGSFRREGSTRFGIDNRWGNFFAVSGGAELTNIINIPRADELKFRASFGRTGQDAPQNGLSQALLGPTGQSFLVGGSFIPVFAPIRNPNPELKWEVKEEINLGLDFAFFNNRLSGAIDVYRADTEDLILDFDVPVPPNIFPTQFVNIGEIRNEGIDVALQFNAIQQRELNWTTGVTFSTFDTKLKSLSSGDLQFGDQQFIANMGAPGLNDTQLIRVKEGESIGDIWGPRFARFTTAADGFTDEDGNPLIGGWLFFDKDGNEVRPENISDEDRVVLGNGLPDFTLGWNNTVSFQNWDFNMFWRGAFGHQMVNSFSVFQTNPSVINARNITRDAVNLRDRNGTLLNESPQFSSLNVENADFFRLDNVTLGYTFSFGADAPIRRLRIFGSGNNLLTITNYNGIDPEPQFADVGATDNANRAGAPNALAPGIERRNQWFTQRSMTFGVNLDF